MGKVVVNLYGAFRRYGNGQNIEVPIEKSLSIDELRQALLIKLREICPNFRDDGLLFDSAFADKKSVLKSESVVSDGDVLAILPPVCGG
ncbi:MAG: hypothetical protein A2Z20_07165 [Bdellovibrionales bacterium RBG_16_40_8]|nr:MAG: hypothetical protein A2Z20_07165 [Bdellovibrionales bacterium RBG_16_40_8]